MSSLTISYDDIFDAFLSSLTDYKLASLAQNDAYQMMSGWLKRGLNKSNVKRLFTISTLDNETQTFTFQLKRTKKDETDEDQIEFATAILCKSMIVEWCEPKVKTTNTIDQMFAGKEQSFYSQATHLTQLRALLEDTRNELRQEIADRGVLINAYLEDD